MKLLFKNKIINVASIENASSIYSELRDKSGLGASKFPNATIVNDSNEFIGHIGYNGKVWPS